MTQLFLETHGLLPTFFSTTDIYMIVVGDSLRGAAKLAKEFRGEGVNVELDFTGRKIDKQLKTAVKKAIPYIMFIGDEELASEAYPLKDTTTSNEQKLSFERVVSTVKDRRRKKTSEEDEFDVSDLSS